MEPEKKPSKSTLQIPKVGISFVIPTENTHINLQTNTVDPKYQRSFTNTDFNGTCNHMVL